MAKTYTVQFKNSTENPYHFAIYQKYPNSPGLESIAWQVRGLAPSATNRVDWTLDYQVAIADWDSNASQYSGGQMIPAKLGQSYEVVTLESDIPSINPNPTAPTGKEFIKLKNNTHPPKKVTMGFAINHKLIAAQKDVAAGEIVEFKVHPKYYIACYRAIEEGQLVSEGVMLQPVTLEFQNDYTDYTVEAVSDAGEIVLKGPVPTSYA